MEKVAKKYLKVYKEQLEAKEAYVYADLNDYLDDQLATYHRFFADRSEVRISSYLTLIKSPYLPGLAIAFKNEDYKLVNDSIYHFTKHDLLNISGSGYDHSGNFWRVLDAMACDYEEVIEKCMPEELGLCGNGYPAFVVGGNLLMALWYKNEQWMEMAYSAGEKFLGQKRGLWDKAIVSFLMALVDWDMEKASEALNNVSKSSTRIDRPRLFKCFCTEAHGLYQIARHVLPKADFEKIRLPEHENFSQRFVLWQEQNNYQLNRELIVHYPEELNVMNEILQMPIPTCKLIGKGKKRSEDFYQIQEEIAVEFSKVSSLKLHIKVEE